MSEKVVRADTFLCFADDVEQTLEILSSEIPISNEQRQTVEESLRKLRKSLSELREQLQ